MYYFPRKLGGGQNALLAPHSILWGMAPLAPPPGGGPHVLILFDSNNTL